jgi:hypothetical protein
MADVIVGMLEALERFAMALRAGLGPVPWALAVGVPFPLLAGAAIGVVRWLLLGLSRGEPLGYRSRPPARSAGSWFPSREPSPDGASFSGVPVSPEEPARATITALVLGVLGLVLALVSAVPAGASGAFLGYVALLLLVGAWAVVRFGVRDPDIQWRRLAVVGWARWYGCFLLVAITLGGALGAVT